MSCATVSVNRALGVLAVMWVMIPVAVVRILEQVNTQSLRSSLLASEAAPSRALPTLLLEPSEPSAREAVPSGGRQVARKQSTHPHLDSRPQAR
jgi:hypothetical protein